MGNLHKTGTQNCISVSKRERVDENSSDLYSVSTVRPGVLFRDKFIRETKTSISQLFAFITSQPHWLNLSL